MIAGDLGVATREDYAKAHLQSQVSFFGVVAGVGVWPVILNEAVAGATPRGLRDGVIDVRQMITVSFSPR